MKFLSGFLVLLALYASFPDQASARSTSLHVANVFGDHMVLQQGKPIAVWGSAKPGEKVEVILGDDTQSCTADEDGTWIVHLPKREASTTPMEMKISGDGGSHVIKDILVGEVWLCGGQSNMAAPLSFFGPPDPRVKNYDYPHVRLMTVARNGATIPMRDLKGRVQWNLATKETSQEFSATALHFGVRIHKALDVPVGLMSINWGGSRIEAWMSAESLKTCGFEKPGDSVAGDLKMSGKTKTQHIPMRANNAMIIPVRHMNIKGAIWYQGESNATGIPSAVSYRKLMPALIEQWRTQFRTPDLPFYMALLAAYSPPRRKVDAVWPVARQAQLETALSDPRVGIANTIDIGNKNNIHPSNKLDVGLRLARLALCNAYGKEGIVENGPLFKSASPDDKGGMVVSFDTFGGTLVSGDDRPLVGFELAGEDRVFKSARATIEENTVHVTCEGVEKPAFVRYGWSGFPDVNLIGGDKLPALPFTTEPVFEPVDEKESAGDKDQTDEKK